MGVCVWRSQVYITLKNIPPSWFAPLMWKLWFPFSKIKRYITLNLNIWILKIFYDQHSIVVWVRQPNSLIDNNGINTVFFIIINYFMVIQWTSVCVWSCFFLLPILYRFLYSSSLFFPYHTELCRGDKGLGSIFKVAFWFEKRKRQAHRPIRVIQRHALLCWIGLW